MGVCYRLQGKALQIERKWKDFERKIAYDTLPHQPRLLTAQTTP